MIRLLVAEDAFSFGADGLQVDAFAADQLGRFVAGSRPVGFVELSSEDG